MARWRGAVVNLEKCDKNCFKVKGMEVQKEGECQWLLNVFAGSMLIQVGDLCVATYDHILTINKMLAQSFDAPENLSTHRRQKDPMIYTNKLICRLLVSPPTHVSQVGLMIRVTAKPCKTLEDEMSVIVHMSEKTNVWKKRNTGHSGGIWRCNGTATRKQTEFCLLDVRQNEMERDKLETRQVSPCPHLFGARIYLTNFHI